MQAGLCREPEPVPEVAPSPSHAAELPFEGGEPANFDNIEHDPYLVQANFHVLIDSR